MNLPPSSSETQQITSTTYREAWPDIGQTCRRVVRTACTQKYLYARLPAIGWARSYKLSYVYQDFVAGITVALTAIPQGIAYAVVAGLEPQVLYLYYINFLFESVVIFSLLFSMACTLNWSQVLCTACWAVVATLPLVPLQLWL